MTSRKYAAFVGIMEFHIPYEQESANSYTTKNEFPLRFLTPNEVAETRRYSPTPTKASNIHIYLQFPPSSLSLLESPGTSRGSASPNLPATSTQISSEHFQPSNNPVQNDNNSRDRNDPTLLNQGRQQQTSTFTGHAERNNHREEAQRAAAEASFTPRRLAVKTSTIENFRTPKGASMI